MRREGSFVMLESTALKQKMICICIPPIFIYFLTNLIFYGGFQFSQDDSLVVAVAVSNHWTEFTCISVILFALRSRRWPSYFENQLEVANQVIISLTKRDKIKLQVVPCYWLRCSTLD